MTGRPTDGLPDYIRDPAEIYRRSFAAVRAESDLSALPASLEGVAVRLIHACGMPDIASDLAWAGDPAEAGRQALMNGAAILTDARMVADGVIEGRLPASNRVLCPLAEPDVADRARRVGTTRSAAAVDLWLPHLDGAVVAIGNAPTALFRLLEVISGDGPCPAVILAFPVGFIGAAESKQALIDLSLGIPFLTLRGRRGGSAMAAAAVNALAGEAA